MKNIAEDWFGFFPEKLIFSFENVTIEPMGNYEDARRHVDEYTNVDGYYYPPIVESVQVDPATNKPMNKIPRTEHPAHLYRIPSSHVLKIENTCQSIVELRNGMTGFLVHLLGYLFGHRLQFNDWWVDNRIPIKRQHGVIVSNDEANDFLQHSLKEWSGWTPDKQYLFTNLLFMHTRVSGYEWEWERFMMEYLIFDALWRFYSKGKKLGVTHSNRFKTMLTDYQMVIHDDKINKIVRLRNGLFHESLWEDNKPGTQASNEAFHSHFWLQGINQRLIPALLNYNTKYITSDWTCMGWISFKS